MEEATVQVPLEFFSDILPRSRDLGELLVTLQVIYLTARRGKRTVPLTDLLAADAPAIVAGPHSPEPAEQRLRRSLERAVASGALLRLSVEQEEGGETYFLLNTAANRTLLDSLRHQYSSAAPQLDLPSGASAVIYRPNVFALYEQHIGPLTPLVAEQLRQAERSYPRAWLEEAMLMAAENNKRSWKYVEAILTRWDREGAPEGAAGKRR